MKFAGLAVLVGLVVVDGVDAIFFGGGGGGCGCSAPPSCACQQPACAPPPPCPVCAPPPPCPPPPAAYCPQVSPVFMPAASPCGVSSSCGAASFGGGYASPPLAPSGGYASSPVFPASSVGGYVGSVPLQEPLPSYQAGPVRAASSYSRAAPVQISSGYSEGPHAVAQGTKAAEVDTGDEPSPTAVFRSPAAVIKEPCGMQPVKYIVLRKKKISNGEENDVEEEFEPVNMGANVEATAAPLDASQLAETFINQGPKLTDEVTKKARAVTTALTDDKCNSDELRMLVLNNIAQADAWSTKKAIHEAAITQYPESSIDVVCSTTGFTYLVATTEHCEAQKDGVICFVYKRPL